MPLELGILVRGMIIGFSVAAPVGPIALLCIRRTLAEGRAAGLAAGLGVALADAVYGFVAGFGVTAVSTLLMSQRWWFQLVGGLFLCYLGVSVLLSPVPGGPERAQARRLTGAIGSTFLLTLANPMTILAFAAIFAGLEVAGPRLGYGSVWFLVGGVFVGSLLWWLTLTLIVGAVKARLSTPTLQWMNRASGAVITGFGLVALVAAWH